MTTLRTPSKEKAKTNYFLSVNPYETLSSAHRVVVTDDS